MRSVFFTKKNRITKAEFIFSMYFIIFYFALFIEDVCLKENYASSIAKALKFLVLLLLVLQAYIHSWKKKTMWQFIAIMALGGILLLASGDFFWIVIMLMGFVSSGISDRRIFTFALRCIVCMSFMVLGLCAIGILPDHLTGRTDAAALGRHSLGFAHSNMLPLCLMYVFIYLVFLRREKLEWWIQCIINIMNLLLYFFCESRNALLGILLLEGIFLIYHGKLFANIFKALSIEFAKYALLMCAAFSIIPSVLRSKGILMSLWYRLDMIFTNRTLLGAAAINRFGLHALNFMKTDQYVNTTVMVDNFQWNGIVLDSAYIYILIRYGLFALVLLGVIYYSVYQKYSYSPLICNVLILITILNVTDNDFLSYGCLPIIVVGVKNIFPKLQ